MHSVNCMRTLAQPIQSEELNKVVYVHLVFDIDILKNVCRSP